MRLLRIMRISRTLRLARLIRLLKTSRLKAIDEFITDRMLRFPWLRVLYKIVVLWMFIFGIAHLVGCLWLHDGVVFAGNPPHGSWIDRRGWYVSNSTCAITLRDIDSDEGLAEGDAVVNNHVMENCVDRDRIMKSHMYWEALYFSITTITSVGFGDITPISTREKIWTIMMEILGGFVWAVVIAVFSDMMYGMGEDHRAFDLTLRRVSTTMDYLGASSELHGSVMEHFNYRYHKHRLFEDNLVQDLPPKLRRQLLELKFQSVIAKVPFFRECNNETLIKICTSMQWFCVRQDERVVQAGDSSRDLFIIEEGEAEATMPNDDSKVIESLPAGSFFGELLFFGFIPNWQTDVRAATFCEMSWLSFGDLSRVLEGDTGLRRRLRNFGRVRQVVYEFEMSELSDPGRLDESGEGSQTTTERMTLTERVESQPQLHARLEEALLCVIVAVLHWR